MNLSTAGFLALESAQRAKIKRGRMGKPGNEPDAPESTLHHLIADHCRAQWPRWKCIHARMDKASGIEAGAHDFTIYLPSGRVLNIECKTRLGKLSEEQRNWSHELEMLGHKVRVVRTWLEFLDVVKSELSTGTAP